MNASAVHYEGRMSVLDSWYMYKVDEEYRDNQIMRETGRVRKHHQNRIFFRIRLSADINFFNILWTAFAPADLC
jgi:hypothetical protein